MANKQTTKDLSDSIKEAASQVTGAVAVALAISVIALCVAAYALVKVRGNG
jgi:hypothetical protein